MLCATAMGCAVLLWIIVWLVLPSQDAGQTVYTDQELQASHAARDVFFTQNQSPTFHRSIRVKPTGQSPILKALESEGLLPVLADRLPADPVVMEGLEGIGTYGGTWLRVANSPSDVSVISWRLAGATLTRWSPLGYPVEPHIAKSVEPSDNHRVWTITLRPGMKWSDGEAFDADDIMYWWECEANNEVLARSPPGWMRSGASFGKVERVDQYAVRFVFDFPHPLFPERLAKALAPLEAPEHYLRKFHPDPAIGDEAVCAQAMRDFQVPSRSALYTHVKQFTNPQHPRLWPWVYRTYKSNPPQVFVRNPYYYVVDSQGNQLPYIDRVQFDVQSESMLGLTAANGGVSMQARHIRFEQYTELMSRRESAGTEVYHWYPSSRSVYVINPNLNRRIDPADPSTQWKAKLLGEKRFRQALSLAINRQQIIDADFHGMGEPAQVAPGKESPFYHERLLKSFTDYDPARANAMLDEIGLTQRDLEGFRTFPNGERMTFFLDVTSFTGVGPAQFVIDDWAEVGVRTIVRERSRPLFYTEKEGRTFDFNVWTGESDHMPMLQARYFIPESVESFYAVGWGRWRMLGGYYNLDTTQIPGAIPVPKDHPFYEAIERYEQALQAPTFDAQRALMSRVMDIAAENTWTISLATPPPQPVVVNKGLHNVPHNALYGALFMTPANAGIETYYFEDPQDSPGAIAEVRRGLVQASTMPGGNPSAISEEATEGVGGAVGGVGHVVGHVGGGRGGGRLGMLIRVTVILVGLLVATLIIVRHPFIGRRLLILIPTLLIISVVIFCIIQLPPGDYLTSRIVQLQEAGDQGALQMIEDLKLVFHYEDPLWKQYARWMGLLWFMTFEQADMGLLQGHMGRSMETGQPVNDIVGDRMMLTFSISLGTIIFTWLTAIPIGIYSAVRQYSVSDYILTLVGFVGMCIPAFLLALVLMAVSGVQGLFSPEYAAQPEWSWGKFIDLLQHLWIPIVVLGIGGTAGMIRVMRANLLDELRKPYVTTAMAKGVRPTKLLFKYPVRLALNPFISGIGGLFPQLVSGGAIVAMVLALPTVGPLLLSALFSQDMYLAGSMLMVLSMLGVLGTLISDLLLLWLDPRIRYEGGTR